MRRRLVLTFHGVGRPHAGVDADEAEVWTPEAWLGAIVDALPADGTVAITFDDGNASDREIALPLLADRGVTAAFFVLAGRLGRTGSLTADDVAVLHDAGMVVGSHGLLHRDWRTLSHPDLEGEVARSRDELASITGAPVRDAACPFGGYDRRVLRALHAAGYERAYTSDTGPSRCGAWLTPRTTVHRGRPLGDWLDLVRAGPARTGVRRSARRLAKRLR